MWTKFVFVFVLSHSSARMLRAPLTMNEQGFREVKMDTTRTSNDTIPDLSELLQALNSWTKQETPSDEHLELVSTTEHTENPDITTTETAVDLGSKEHGKAEMVKVQMDGNDKDAPLEAPYLNQWNSLTHVGWNDESLSRPTHKMYVNNTRIVKYFNFKGNESNLVLPLANEITTLQPFTAESTIPDAIDRSDVNEKDTSFTSDEEEENSTLSKEEEIKNSLSKEENANNTLTKEETSLSNNTFVARSIWHTLTHFYDCVKYFSVNNGVFQCLQMRFRALFFDFVGRSNSTDYRPFPMLSSIPKILGQLGLANAKEAYEEEFEAIKNEEEEEETEDEVVEKLEDRDIDEEEEDDEERLVPHIGHVDGYYDGKRLMKRFLLPLLVLIVIKYLIFLPLLVISALVMKSFWFSVISAGVAAFYSFLKKTNELIIYKNSNKKFGPPPEFSSIPSPYWGQIPLPVAWPNQKEEIVGRKMDYYM